MALTISDKADKLTRKECTDKEIKVSEVISERSYYTKKAQEIFTKHCDRLRAVI